MLEKDIEKKVYTYGKTLGIDHYKFTSPARAAVPDRMFVSEGRVFFIEFKQTGKKPTPAQEREITRLRNNGVPVFVVDTVDGGKYIMDMVHMGMVPDRIPGSGLS
jgi:hypothetical protein